ncbi:glycosyltransferase [Marivibrio halodurans]|uniref:Glycosyltransferase n=1 Tax=Marivibrio halodurans TaxID=2039722 RepID=A0A8J7SMN5_9PROT|nr:glycosyltransferase [Marivibrio halodurans]MBP5857076.1 glycosyltransferase [Marivibrio halodurans]
MAGAPVGGAEAFFTRLVPALARAGQQQLAVIRTHAPREHLLRDAGVETVALPFRGRPDFISPWLFKRAARRYRPDIVLTWMNRATRAAPAGPWTFAARLGGYYDLKHYRRCDHLIGNTEDIRRYLIDKGWPKDRVWYLPNFVDAQAMPPVNKADLDTPDEAPLLLCLGRLHRNKGFDVALAALAQLPGAYLWIAGIGPEEARLKALAGELGVAGRVRFLGWRADVPALFASADIFLCSSRHEPLGNMVIEAWAHGVPVVAAASQGPRQLIVDGRTGLLAANEDADALARAAGRVIADPALGVDLASQGREVFQSRYDEATVVAAYQDFFERVRPGSPEAPARAASDMGGAG